MLQVALVSALLVVSSQAWMLNTNHESIEVGKTTGVFLFCHYDSAKETIITFKEIVRIIIFRPCNNGSRDIIAEVWPNRVVKQNDFTMTYEFHTTTDLRKSFIKITWPVALNSTAGKYQCEIDGYIFQEGAKSISSNVVTIEEVKITLESLRMLINETRTEFLEKESQMKNEIEQLGKELENANNASANAQRLIRESITHESEKIRKDSREAHQLLRNAISESDKKNQAAVTKIEAEIEDIRNETSGAFTRLIDSSLTLEQTVSNMSAGNQQIHKKLWESINKERVHSDEEDMILFQAISALQNSTSLLITKQRIEIEKEILMDISKLNETYQMTISSLQTELYDTQTKFADDLARKNKEFKDRLKQETSRLSKDSREGDEKLLFELLDLSNKTFEEIARQNLQTVELQSQLSNKSDENREIVNHLKRTISDLRNFTVSEIQIQKHGIEKLLEEEILNVKILASNQTTQEIQKVIAMVQKHISDVTKRGDEIDRKIQEEIIHRQAQIRQGQNKLETDIMELRQATIHELLNQSEECDKKIKSEIDNLSNQINTDHMQLRHDVQETHQKSEQRDEQLALQIQELKNISAGNTPRTEFESVVQGSISAMKNYTQNEIVKVGEKCTEEIGKGIQETKNSIGIDINNATQSVKEELQDDILKLKNFTISKRKEMDGSLSRSLKAFMHLVEAEYVKTSNLSNQLIIMQNSTDEEITKQHQRILELKMFTVKELTMLEQNLNDDHHKIYNLIHNETVECKTLYSELKSSVSESNDQLLNKTYSLERSQNKSDRRVNTRLANLDNAVTDMAHKYQNITDNLNSRLATLAQCACPTAVSTHSTAKVTTQGIVTSASTGTMTVSPDTSGMTSFPTTELTTTTATPTTATTTHTTPKINEWPEGTYATVEPETGCPQSDGFSWSEGWINFHTASDIENNDLVSPGNHFKKPIFNYAGIDNFMRLSYCLRKKKDVNARKWPKGSYCMNRVGGECPSGFASGYIQYDSEHTHIQHKVQEPPDYDALLGSLDRVYYCCRSDGPTATPIYLPNRSPFYLYREQHVVCQSVWGMRVEAEMIQIDTNHDDNRDKFERPDTHPFANLHPVNHTLCYYSPLPASSNS